MEIIIKSFEQLTNRELFEILKSRCAVFVVEQNCAYQDIDDLDLVSHHIFIKENEQIKGYLRIFTADDEWAKIGRVITTERGKGYGIAVLKAGVKACGEILGKDKIYIEAQCYAVPFYAKEGFVTVGEEFLEDGIPHIKMVRE